MIESDTWHARDKSQDSVTLNVEFVFPHRSVGTRWKLLLACVCEVETDRRVLYNARFVFHLLYPGLLFHYPVMNFLYIGIAPILSDLFHRIPFSSFKQDNELSGVLNAQPIHEAIPTFTKDGFSVGI